VWGVVGARGVAGGVGEGGAGDARDVGGVRHGPAGAGGEEVSFEGADVDDEDVVGNFWGMWVREVFMVQRFTY
jgi:hypothetical protein